MDCPTSILPSRRGHYFVGHADVLCSPWKPNPNASYVAARLPGLSACYPKSDYAITFGAPLRFAPMPNNTSHEME